MINGSSDADATTPSDGSLIVSVADLLPGNVLLYRANSQKPYQQKISAVTGSLTRTRRSSWATVWLRIQISHVA